MAGHCWIFRVDADAFIITLASQFNILGESGFGDDSQWR